MPTWQASLTGNCLIHVRHPSRNMPLITMSDDMPLSDYLPVMIATDNIEGLHDWCKKRFEGMGEQLEGFFKEVWFSMSTL